MIKKLGNSCYLLVSAVLIFQMVGCGTILYPERRGQRTGHVDIGVALLDGIGLFFFIIPGIIAYAVDFSNGTIYLPRGERSSLDIKNIREVKFDPKNTNMAGIEKIVKNETGYDVRLYQSTMKISKLKSSKDLLANFAQALPEIQNTRIVLLNQ